MERTTREQPRRKAGNETCPLEGGQEVGGRAFDLTGRAVLNGRVGLPQVDGQGLTKSENVDEGAR